MAFGKIIPGLKINDEEANYPVLDERCIRATSGLMMLIGVIAFFFWYIAGISIVIYIVVSLFWVEFFIKTIFGPQYAPISFIGKKLLKKHNPERVGAIQKRFARGIGLGMATAMFIIFVIFGIRGIAPMAICFTCLFFMWMESALGICVGCKIYYGLIKIGLLKEPKIRLACPGGSCSIKK